jgi:hypothetical protein
MDKQQIAQMQKKLEEVFPVIASGSYVRPFKTSSICWPLNWTYLGHKEKETIEWEYRINSRKLPFFIYREKYSFTTIQANFSLSHSDEQQTNLSSMYLDQDELTHNQSQFDSEMRTTPNFKHDHLIIQPNVDEGAMLEKICKFDRKLSLALSSLNYLFENKKPVNKIPIERMFEPVRQCLAIPLIAEFTCSRKGGFPSPDEVLKYSRQIWEKIDF